MANPGRLGAWRIVLTAVLIPLAVLALGVWQIDRGAEDAAELAAQRAAFEPVVLALEARPEPARGLDLGARFEWRGQTYVGGLAKRRAREVLDDLTDGQRIADVRRFLPPVTVACAGLTASMSLLVLLGAAVLGRVGLSSREALVRGFSVLRRVLPFLLGAQVALLAVCVVTVMGFESLSVLEAGDLSSGGAKLLAIAAMMAGFSLWTAIKALIQLRRTAALFTPDPMTIFGRAVAPEEAPGLWRLVDGLAERLGALRPDSVVLGLTGGFFVSSGPKLLQPGGTPLTGRTLYLPLPYLPLLRPDEVAAIIGHELAHFSGSDTEYSLRFLPIYAGVERSLDAVLAAGLSSAGSVSLLTRPSLRLGIYAMERFHHAVRHWSRLREFAADAAGAAVTSADAASRALLRVGAIEARIDETLGRAHEAPDAAEPDLVAATLRTAIDHGLDDPARFLDDRQPHPTDSHPPTRQRLAALGAQPDAVMLAEAAMPPPPDALSRLSGLFADADAVCRRATADFLDMARGWALDRRRALEQAAAAGAEALALSQDVRGVAIVGIVAGLVLAGPGLTLLAVGMHATDVAVTRAVGAIALCGGLAAIGFGVYRLRRSPEPFLLLHPDGLRIPGLDRAIAWSHIADLDMAMARGGISTRMLLLPEATFPRHAPAAGWRIRRRVHLDPARRIVTLTSALPRGMKPQGFADLLARYRDAEIARRLLDTTPAPSHAQDAA